MKITNQDKINISFIFISAYENIVNLIKPIHNSLSELLKGSSEIYNDIIFSMYKIFKEKYNDKKTLKIKFTHRLLVDVGIFSKEDLESLIKLSKIRNDIGHESMNIYLNKNIGYEYFMLSDLLKLYKKFYNKFSTILIKENLFESNKIFSKHKFDYECFVQLIDDLLIDLKFKEIKDIFN